MDRDIFQELNAIREHYNGGNISIVEGLDYSQKELITDIEYYSNSRYKKGQKDDYGRDKPFYNIGNYRVNVARRATDFDTKDIRGEADSPEHSVEAFILQHEVAQWMKRTNFAKTLNKMGATRPKYGGLLVKKVIKDGELFVEVANWKNTITDMVDIDNGYKIEEHFMSPLKLHKMRGVWDRDEIDECVEHYTKKNKESALADIDIPVYEVEVELPKDFITGKESDEDEFSLQLYYIAGDEENKQWILHSEELKESRYKYLPWEEVEGRGLGRGVMEDGIEAQIATNDSILKLNDAMQMASKVVYQTDDDLVEDNLLTDVDTGHIVKLQQGRVFNQINTVSGSIPAYENLINLWNDQYEKVSSTFPGITGEEQPSGTPFRSVAVQNQEAASLFVYRREEMGIFLNEILSEWIVPHLIKKIYKEHILASDFSAQEIESIDRAFAEYKAQEGIIDEALNAPLDEVDVTQGRFDELQSEFRSLIRSTNESRFIKVPKGFLKNAKARVTFNMTNEQKNKAVQLESLNNILITVAQNPQILQDPTLSQIFSRIIEMAGAGLSPVSLGIGVPQKGQAQGKPTQGLEALVQANGSNNSEVAGQVQ